MAMNSQAQQETKKGERKMSKKANGVPKTLYNNIHRILPLVVNRELPIEELLEFLAQHGRSCQPKAFLKFIRTYFFKRKLVEYLEAIEDDTDPEFYIELYLFP